MLRKTLTILSLLGLLLSVGLWWMSWRGPLLITSTMNIELRQGYFSLGWCWPKKGRVLSEQQKEDLNRFLKSYDHHRFTENRYLAWNNPRYEGTHWWPPECVIFNPTKHVLFPLWMPTLLFPLLSWACYFPVYRRRKRKKLGLCVKCGYDLRASKDQCPECGTGSSS